MKLKNVPVTTGIEREPIQAITRIPKIITRRQKDMSIERIFSKEITLKREDKHAIQNVQMLVKV